MGQTVQLLENALRAWEDLHLIHEARVRIGLETGKYKPKDFTGSVRHWRELRNHLLSLKGSDFDVNRFTPVDAQTGARREFKRIPLSESELDGPLMNGLYESLPMQLASWIISSRRVFSVSSEMIERFVEADYSNYVWSDLLWPFDSFFIQFDLDLEVDDEIGKSSVGGLLISSVYGVCPEHTLAAKEGFECLIFMPVLDDKTWPEELLTAWERERLETNLRHKQWAKLDRRVANVFQRITKDDDSFDTPTGTGPPMCWEKSEPIQSGNAASELIGKIIAGLCLYLEALPAGTAANYGWRQPVPPKLHRGVRKIITDGELVCRVEDFNVISPETITLFPETLRQGPAYTVTPHWRRAHYRRARGQGNNPNAPKTIKVGATLIHKDQVPEGAVPGGSVSSVK